MTHISGHYSAKLKPRENIERADPDMSRLASEYGRNRVSKGGLGHWRRFPGEDAITGSIFRSAVSWPGCRPSEQ